MKTLLIGLMTALSISTQAVALPRVQTFGGVRQQLLEDGWIPFANPARSDNTRTLTQLALGFEDVVYCAPLTSKFPHCLYMWTRISSQEYLFLFTIENPLSPQKVLPESQLVIDISVKHIPF